MLMLKSRPLRLALVYAFSIEHWWRGALVPHACPDLLLGRHLASLSGWRLRSWSSLLRRRWRWLRRRLRRLLLRLGAWWWTSEALLSILRTVHILPGSEHVRPIRRGILSGCR